MVVTSAAISLIAVTLLALVATGVATIYYLPPYINPPEDDGHHG